MKNRRKTQSKQVCFISVLQCHVSINFNSLPSSKCSPRHGNHGRFERFTVLTSFVLPCLSLTYSECLILLTRPIRFLSIPPPPPFFHPFSPIFSLCQQFCLPAFHHCLCINSVFLPFIAVSVSVFLPFITVSVSVFYRLIYSLSSSFLSLSWIL